MERLPEVIIKLRVEPGHALDGLLLIAFVPAHEHRRLISRHAGAIIEKISGVSYEQFMQQHIFEPLDMRQSYYDHPTRIIPKRAAGYQKGPDGYTNAEYLSMTQPYAAGCEDGEVIPL